MFDGMLSNGGVLISSAPLTRRGRVLLDAQPSTWQATIRIIFGYYGWECIAL